MDLEKAKMWINLNPPRERIVDHKIMQSYWHEYPLIRDLVAEIERLQDKIDHPAAVILELRAENVQLRADALRYREGIQKAIDTPDARCWILEHTLKNGEGDCCGGRCQGHGTARESGRRE